MIYNYLNKICDLNHGIYGPYFNPFKNTEKIYSV